MATTRRALQWDDVTEGQRIIVEYHESTQRPPDRGVYQGLRSLRDAHGKRVGGFAVLWQGKDEYEYAPTWMAVRIRRF